MAVQSALGCAHGLIIVVQGLRTHGRADEANVLAAAMIEAAVRNDFPEYINPLTGQAHGTRQFSWTAALALDLYDRSRAAREGRSDKRTAQSGGCGDQRRRRTIV